MNNLELMQKRLEWQGGIAQEKRMIKDKWRTLQRVLKYSYQGCDVQLVQKHIDVLPLDGIDSEFSVYELQRALINPDKTKQDYDDKIISIDYLSKFEPGDVFNWVNTKTQWIIYLEEITEDAYFRGEIRRCRYQINFLDQNGNSCSTYAAIRGPVETQINSIQKNQERIDKPNLSLNILIPKNDKTLYAFERYREFILEGRAWRVETIDSISMRNIIEVNAEEYYLNEYTDDIDNSLSNGLTIKPIEEESGPIQGNTFIKPKLEERYKIDIPDGQWSIKESEVPVSLCVIDSNTVKILWNKMTHGQFTLIWSKDSIIYEKTIVVESLF